jgi:hypothetical protein
MTITRPLLAVALLLPAVILPACAVQQDHKRMARAFLNGRTAEETLAPASMDFEFYVDTADSEPMTRDQFRDAIQWDVTLNRITDIHQMHSRTNTATAVVHETNDFATLLGHPGWDATMTFYFDDPLHGGLICDALYQPSPDNPPLQPYLDAALPYLRAHHPDTLAEIYPDGTLVMTAETARAWTTLLTEWQAAGAPTDIGS